nr:MAG TPA: protein of unknown function (DUF4969) [Caudoviricetes sp.]
MKILKFGIIVILLSFMTSCSNNPRYYVPNDKGIVVGIQKVQNDNEVTIMIVRNPKQGDLRSIDTYITFLTHKKYNINDTVYFTNLK